MASTWSFLTLSLKSTLISAIGPETNDPTETDWTGLIGPDELTTVSTLPVETVAVVNLGTDLAFRYCCPKWPAVSAPPARRPRAMSHLTRRRMRVSLVRGVRAGSVA